MRTRCTVGMEMAAVNRGRRRSAFGHHGDRLRGGFQASMLPGYSSSGAEASQSTSGANLTANGAGSTSSNSTVIIQQLGDSCELEGGELSGAIGGYVRGLVDQQKRVELRLAAMKKKQDKTSEMIKDVLDLLKKLRKESFSIKGSAYEVCFF